jgi:hypothetical protein
MSFWFFDIQWWLSNSRSPLTQAKASYFQIEVEDEQLKTRCSTSTNQKWFEGGKPEAAKR